MRTVQWTAITLWLTVMAMGCDSIPPMEVEDPATDAGMTPRGDGGPGRDGGEVTDRDGGGPVCGDGMCAGETCVSCPADCECGAGCDWVASDTGPTIGSRLESNARTVTVNGHTVDYVDFALPPATPDYRLWSVWGEGEVASTGKYYGSVGDHGNTGGNSYLYEYDPTTRTLRAVTDVLETYDAYEPGSFGYGKVHGQVDEGPCGALYFSTYRGSTSGSFGGSYHGDLLVRYNPATGHSTVLGTPIENWQTPSTNLWRAGGLMYGEANTFDSDMVRFWVFDIATQEVVWEADPVARRNRHIAIDAEGRAYFGEGTLHRFDPATREETTVSGYPGGLLRASTAPRADGKMVVITHGGDEAYLFDPVTSSFEHIASMSGYVASVALSGDGSAFYAIPGAHGGMPFPVERYDIATGSRTVLGELLGPIQRDNPSGLGPCSTYGVHVSPDGSVLYATANATSGGTGDCLRSGSEGAMVVAVHL